MLRGPDGRMWVPASEAYRAGMGQALSPIPELTPQAVQSRMAAARASKGPLADVLSEFFTLVPAFYTVSIELGGTDGAQNANSTPLRPEPFVCSRITWATTGDTPRHLGEAVSGGAQGKVVEITWEDEFTKFLGNQPCLISALFGDSNGFLDLPKGILLQGKQSLTVSLRRITWPSAEDVATTRFDINFQGLGLLPKGINQSGSAG